jgi:hypothetical protein
MLTVGKICLKQKRSLPRDALLDKKFSFQKHLACASCCRRDEKHVEEWCHIDHSIFARQMFAPNFSKKCFGLILDPRRAEQ